MKVEKYLPKSSQEKISNAVTEAEKKIHAEIVPVFMTSSDDYTEAKLRGAILGATLTSIAIIVYDHLMGWYQLFLLENDWLFVSTIALGGVLGYLLFSYVTPLKRLLVSRQKMNQASYAMAERVFGEYKLFETKSRNGILIFISLFEHKVEILPDIGISKVVQKDEWTKVIDGMKPSLRAKNFDQAFIDSISKVTEILDTYKIHRDGTAQNELPDHLRENK